MTDKLQRGSVVMMSGSSGCPGYGNEQCVSSVCEPLGEVGLFGHNQHYKIRDVLKIIYSPSDERAKVLSEVEEWVHKNTHGHYGIEVVGRVGILAKLNQLKGEMK